MKGTGSEALLQVVYYVVRSWCIRQTNHDGYETGGGTINCIYSIYSLSTMALTQ